MPDWKQSLNILVLLSIAGFGLVITSLFWRIAIFLALAAIILWFPRRRR